MRRLAIYFATGFGLGRMPIASGTFGTLLGIPLALLMRGWPLWLQGPYCLALALFAIFVCDAAENEFGTKDDGRIVADEYTTFPLCVIGLINAPWSTLVWLLPVAFVMHRAMDILKPFPARRLQALRGGLGIVIDDVISSIYALVIVTAAFHLYVKLFTPAPIMTY